MTSNMKIENENFQFGAGLLMSQPNIWTKAIVGKAGIWLTYREIKDGGFLMTSS